MSRLLVIVFITLVFSLGWVSNSMYYAVSSPRNIQKPFIFNAQGQKIVSTPSDRITPERIHVYEDKVVIDIKNASWSTFTPTHSMEPIISEKANGLEIKPSSFVDLKIGDIVSYKSEYADGLIVHRIVETGFDEKGWYAIIKGDNNPQEDPGKVRFEQIHGVLIGVIY
ncbi:MAG: hypothetical protein QXG86_01560 [Candidatus Woesearchaeota archaeon]